MRELFDAQIIRLFDLINRQLKKLQQTISGEQVGHLVLSGGLGQSAYVRDMLIQQYVSNPEKLPNAQFMAIRIAPDPQLAVCKGLVADRYRKLKVGESVLGWRCCRASYGVTCREVFDKRNPKHVGRQIEKDPMDNKVYVTNCVAWFVRKVSGN